MDQGRNHKGKWNILRYKWKWEHSMPLNILDAVKAVLGEKFINISSYIKKKRKLSDQQPNFIA